MIENIPEVGAPFCWTPAAFSSHSDATAEFLGASVRVSGRVAFVHKEHRFFRVEGRVPGSGAVIRECFKF